MTPATCLAFVSIAAFSSVLLTGPRNVTVPPEVMIFTLWAFVDNEYLQPQPGGQSLRSADQFRFLLDPLTFELPHSRSRLFRAVLSASTAVEDFFSKATWSGLEAQATSRSKKADNTNNMRFLFIASFHSSRLVKAAARLFERSEPRSLRRLFRDYYSVCLRATGRSLLAKSAASLSS